MLVEYFAYGSNLDRRRFKARCPGSRPVAPAELRGYRLAFRGNGHADIVQQKGGVVRGALYSVTTRDVRALDYYEGVPVYYHRITVFVKDEGGRLRRALAYKMRNDVADAPPSLSYVLTIVCGCRDWNIEPDDEVKAAMELAQATPGREE
jgi:gamma-glutamylcyclotransferase (GGCT)/AIG2-like uncharacterized protein YtfP